MFVEIMRCTCNALWHVGSLLELAITDGVVNSNQVVDLGDRLKKVLKDHYIVGTAANHIFSLFCVGLSVCLSVKVFQQRFHFPLGLTSILKGETLSLKVIPARTHPTWLVKNWPI